jgi:hypothetical protein
MSRGALTSVRPRRVLAMMLLAACGADPDVEISTYVGPTHARHDAAQRVEHAKEVLAAKFSDLLSKPADTTEDAPGHSVAPVHPPRDAAQLQELIDAIERAPLSEIDGPARRIAEAGPEIWPQVRRLLQAERRGTKGEFKSLLRAIGGDLPNRYGHFALQWKQDHGFSVKRSEDWFEDLLSLPTSKVSGPLRKVYRDSILVTALLRAASRAGKEPKLAAETVGTLLDLAWAEDGIWRDEISRSIESIGDEAVAPLVAMSVVPPFNKRTEFEVPVQRPRYAQAMLDRMDRLVPSRAVGELSTDPNRLARLLAAYGVTRRADATDAVLAHVDHDVLEVRSSARIAWYNFVAGPLPKANSRKIKLLGGGTGRAQAFLSYRARAELALRQTLVEHAPALLESEPECDVRREDGSIDRHCEGQPLRLTDTWLAHLDEARRVARRARLDEALATSDPDLAVARIDELVARRESIERADEVARFLADIGRAAIERGEPARGAQLLRKAAVLSDPLDPPLGRTLRIEALLAEASVEGLEPAGRQMLLRSAETLAPQDARVQSALATRADGRPTTEDAARPPALQLAGGVGLLALAFGCLSLLGGSVRRRL